MKLCFQKEDEVVELVKYCKIDVNKLDMVSKNILQKTTSLIINISVTQTDRQTAVFYSVIHKGILSVTIKISSLPRIGARQGKHPFEGPLY